MRKIGRKLLSGDSRFYFVVRSSERSTLVFYTKAQNSGCGDTSCFNRCFLSLSLSLSLSHFVATSKESSVDVKYRIVARNEAIAARYATHLSSSSGCRARSRIDRSIRWNSTIGGNNARRDVRRKDEGKQRSTKQRTGERKCAFAIVIHHRASLTYSCVTLPGHTCAHRIFSLLFDVARFFFFLFRWKLLWRNQISNRIWVSDFYSPLMVFSAC